MLIVGGLVAIALLLLPPLSIVGVVLWAWRLRRQKGTPRFAVWLAYALAAAGGLAIVGGAIFGVATSTGAASGGVVEPSRKARALAEGISEFMNCSALGQLAAIAAAGWLAFWTLRARRFR